MRTFLLPFLVLLVCTWASLTAAAAANGSKPKVGKATFRGKYDFTQPSRIARLLAIPLSNKAEVGALAVNGTSNPSSKQFKQTTDSIAHTLTIFVSVGTPGQFLEVILDSGSPFFWVRSPQCTHPVNCAAGLPVFDNKKSRTYRSLSTGQDPSKNNIQIRYGDNTTILCTINQDRVDIAGITIQNQSLCEASAISSDTIAGTNTDGLIGIAPPGSNVRADVFSSMMRLRLVENPYIGFWYNRSSVRLDGDAGEVTFGGIDETKFNGPLTWFPLPNPNPLNHWATQYQGVSINGVSLTKNDPTAIAIFDTGTTLVLLPSRAVDEIVRATKAVKRMNDFYAVDCRTASSLPAVSFLIGGQTLTIKGDQLVFKRSTVLNPPASQSKSNTAGGADMDPVNGTTATMDCQLIFAPINPSSDVDVILGALFLQNYYNVFDFGGNRTGLAPSIQKYTFEVPANYQWSGGLKPTAGWVGWTLAVVGVVIGVMGVS
ncbi:hypothetical protein HK104_003614 [Borealophlyctis nickersoniae]|nr:hypothetical protein HK104_003614 [Borealophlyctis nickersoniae]